MQENNKYKEVLAREGLKNTRHRKAILKIFEEADMPLAAEDIYLKLKDNNVSICYSTVYRVLEMLSANKLITRAGITDDNRARFVLNPTEHKHNVICTRCHKMVYFDFCPVEAFNKKLRKDIDFEVTGHVLEIYGLCAACKGKEQGSQ